ncbi:hypothetical protein [Nocardia sp. NPDC051570]|uniref:hypothetical protein n=1 Tax=Nocardia sp. NPDC051570 TaxID=3364324 RepID=UPI00378879AD
MALGHEAAANLWRAAAEGRFRLEEGAARECAGHYEWFAEEMVGRQRDLDRLKRLEGFGNLTSSQYLQKGFQDKAHQAFDAFKAAEESAYKMAAAIYKAAGLTNDVEAANAAAIRAAQKVMTDG